MSILVDSGNSRIKLARWSSQAQQASDRPSYDHVAIFDNHDLASVAAWLADTVGTCAIHQAIGVNVAGQARQDAMDELFARHGLTPLWQRATARTGRLVNGYAQPGRLGADRWAALVGVTARWHPHDTPYVLASFGTATTIDIVGPDKVFQGGLILPGPTMMRRALSEGTANLPCVESGSTLFPIDTHQAIATGVAAAQAGAVLRQILAGHERFGDMPALYVTGGAWIDIEAETRRLLDHAWPSPSAATMAIQVLDQPVLDGLAEIAALHLRQKRLS